MTEHQSAPMPTYEEFVKLALTRIQLADDSNAKGNNMTADHHRSVALVYATLAAGVTPNIDLARTRVFEVIQESRPADLVDISRMTSWPEPNKVGPPIVEAPTTTLKTADSTVWVDDKDEPIEPIESVNLDPRVVTCPSKECGHSALAHYGTVVATRFGCKFCECPRSLERVMRVDKAIGTEKL